MRVLIAEDEPVSRRLLEATLAKWGYDVEVAREGKEAWARLQSADAPRLAILDWMMPGMDGVEVCRALRSSEREGYVYVIMLTAKGRNEDIVEGLDAGADDHVIKPFDPQELRARLRVGLRMLDLEAQARETAKLRTIRDLAAGVAHNFNNILSAVLGYSSFVREALEEQGASLADIDKLINSAKRASHLGVQLAECARPASGPRKRITLGLLVADLAAECEKSLADNIHLVVNAGAEQTHLDVLPGSLQSALMSICTNAQEAMPDGGTLTIAADKTRPKGEQEAELALITFSDTGIGIEEDVLPKIFDPFFSTKQTVGVGLSLALTHRVIADHGGRIEIESVSGEGTEFRVLLPVIERDNS